MTLTPERLRIRLDPSARRGEDGLLVGGFPRRFVRLSPEGWDAIEGLVGPGAVPAAWHRLGQYLVAAGLAHPAAEPRSLTGRVTVVVPVRDRPAELARCLDRLGDGVPVIVVDDGSDDPAASRVAAPAARVMQRGESGGPAAARNAGVAAAGTELIAFVDSDVELIPEALERLIGHFDDPAVGAVAPRVRPARGRRGVLARYLTARSPLDMGRWPSAVGPGRRVPYVPTAALIVRRAALPALDEELSHGEDVDLVWRMVDAGWDVRYDPEAVARHQEPTRLGAVLRRRHRYGMSAAPLSRRHPSRLAHLVLPVRPLLLTAKLLWRGAHPGRRQLATTFASMVHETATGALRYGATVGAPVAVPMLWRRGWRGRLALLAYPGLREWARGPKTLDPGTFVALSVLDDAAYAAGVWRGCARDRTLEPLLPRVVVKGSRPVYLWRRGS